MFKLSAHFIRFKFLKVLNFVHWASFYSPSISQKLQLFIDSHYNTFSSSKTTRNVESELTKNVCYSFMYFPFNILIKTANQTQQTSIQHKNYNRKKSTKKENWNQRKISVYISFEERKMKIVLYIYCINREEKTNLIKVMCI